MVHVVIADDDPRMRSALVDVLDDTPEFSVVGEAATAEEAVAVCHRLTPEMLLLDLRMPGTGERACRQLRIDLPHMVIVVISARTDAVTVSSALDAGAGGFLTKGLIGNDLADMLTRCLRGQLVVATDRRAVLLAQDPTRSSRSI